MLGDVTPGSRATAGGHRSNQVRLLGSNQQPSHPLERLLWGGWTPTRALFRLSVVEQVQLIQPPGCRPYRAWLDPSPGREEGRG